jgi:methylphosphotriester-DNA--protein-cysteine methyltransferase
LHQLPLAPARIQLREGYELYFTEEQVELTEEMRPCRRVSSLLSTASSGTAFPAASKTEDDHAAQA